MKKFTAIILSLAAALSLTACGNQESSAAGGNDNSSGFENSSSNGGFGNFGDFGNNDGNNANGENTGGSNTGAQESTMDFTFYLDTYKNCTVVPLDPDRGTVRLSYKDSETKLIYVGSIKNGRADGNGYVMLLNEDVKEKKVRKEFNFGTFSNGRLNGVNCYTEVNTSKIDDVEDMLTFYYAGRFKENSFNGYSCTASGFEIGDVLWLEYGLFKGGSLDDGFHYGYDEDGSLKMDLCYSVSNGVPISESLTSTKAALTPEELSNALNNHFGYGEQYEMAMKWIDSL